MNVACTACPAKYAVPDDRVRGKRARITCKHCGTAIIVDGTGLGPSSAPLKPEPGRQIRHTLVELPAPSAPPRAAAITAGALKSRAPGTGSRPALGGTASRPSASAPSFAPAKESDADSDAGAWLVALPNGRREPASLARIVDLFTAGTLDDSTYIWREGMPEWKPPRSIPEIARALTVRQNSPATTSAPLARPREYEEDEATRVAISPTDEALRSAPSSRPRPPSNGPNRGPARSGVEEGAAMARGLGPPPSRAVSKAPPREEPPGSRSSPSAEDIIARSRGVSTLRKKPSSSAAPPPPRDPAPAPPGRTPRRTLPPGAISIAMAGSDLMRRVPSPPTPMPPVVEPVPVAPAQLASPPLRAAPDLEGSPRSAAPVSVPLERAHDPVPRRRNLKGWLLGAAGALLLAIVGAGYATKWKFPSFPRSEPTLVAKTPSVEPVPISEPTPAPQAGQQERPSSIASATPSPDRDTAVEPSPALQVDRAAVSLAPRTSKAAFAKSLEKARKAASEAEPGAVNPAAPSDASEDAASETKEGTEPAAPAEGPAFDRDAAAAALGEAASRAQSCAKLGGPTGSASVTITFGTNGQVSGASVGGEYAGTSVGNCVLKLFRVAKVPAFGGGQPVAVSKRFSID